MLDGLGTIYTRGGLHREAERCYRKALMVRRKALPANHPDTLRVLSSLGVVLTEMGRFNHAEP